MEPDQLNGLMTAIGELLSAILWPALVVFLAVSFGPVIKDKVANSDVTLKAAGVEASFQQLRVESAAALGAAEGRIEGNDPSSSADPDGIASTVAGAVPDAKAQRRLQGSSILWVDDRPDNNRYERQALEALGIRVDISMSTEDALERLRHAHFDLVISDMGRPPDSKAGYTLLDQLRASGNRIPFLLYAGSRLPEHVQEARERGALGCTNSPQELILMVTGALGVRSRNWSG